MSKVIAAIVIALGLLIGGIAIGRMIGGPSSATPAPETADGPGHAARAAAPERPEPAPREPASAEPATVEPATTERARPTPDRPVPRRGARAPAVLEPPKIDLGYMEPGQTMTNTFQVRNTGTEPLVVEALRADCRCTTLENLDGRTIAPGEAVDVTARMKYEMSTTGPRMSRVTFKFEGYDEPLEMRINVELAWAVKTTPAYIALGRAAAGELKVESIDGRPFRILAVHGAAPDLVDHGPGDPPRSAYTVRWDLSRFDLETCTDAAGNRMPPLFIIETDHPDAPIVDLLVRHGCTRSTAVGGWRTADPGVVLGRVEAGVPIEVTVDIQWLRASRGAESEIESASSDSPQLASVELVDFQRRGMLGTCTVRITPASSVEGLLFAPITLASPKGGNDVVIIGSVR